MKNLMKSWILGLVIVAAALNGLLAGGNVDRALVAMPAWRQVGTTGWAEFSRHADLANGQWVYPALAFGGTLTSVIAAILCAWAWRRDRRAVVPVALAAVLMLVSLPVSFQAIPYMQSLRHISNDDPAALVRAFSGFEFWGRFQGILHVMAFGANLWSLIVVANSGAWNENSRLTPANS